MIDPHAVPREVLAAFASADPDPTVNGNDAWRVPLAAALSVWDETRTEHDHRWKRIGSQKQSVFGIKTTFVALECRICGDLRTSQLNGEWDLLGDTDAGT
jgi:hypothetical protein